MKLFNKTICISLSLICCFSFLSSCNKNDAPINPCENYQKPNPTFWVQDEVQKQFSQARGFTFGCDTIGRGGQYTFTSELNYESYTWDVIGNPSFIRNTKSFTLTFPEPIIIQMRLVGKRKPNAKCDPNDDGIDTIIKTITVLKVNDSIGLMYGKFIGYDSTNPNLEVGLEIVYERPAGYSNFMPVIKYFPDSCKDKILLNGSGITGGYNLLHLDRKYQFGCQSPEGWFVFTPNGVEIQYTTRNIPDVSAIITKRKFVGRRI
jgi:hypothetical protein